MASQAQKHSSGQTSDDVKSLRTKVRQMEERIIELEKAVERIDVLEERLAQISLSHGSDGASKGAECTGAKAVIPLTGQSLCACVDIFVLHCTELWFERNTTFSIPATKEQSDFEFLRNSTSPPMDFVQCKATHPLMKNLATRRMMQCLLIKPNVVPLPEAAGGLCLYGNNTKENSWDTDIESSSPLSTTDRQSIMLSPNIMPTWSPSASDFQTCAASSSVGNFQTGETSSSVSDFETSVTSPSASRILVSQKFPMPNGSQNGATVQTLCDRFKEFHRHFVIMHLPKGSRLTLVLSSKRMSRRSSGSSRFFNVFHLFHPLCRHQVIFSRRCRRKKAGSALPSVLWGSHPAQIYLVIDCEYTTGCSTLFSFLESLLNLQSKQTRQPSVGLAHLSRCARRDSASTPNLVCSAHHVFYSVMHQYSDQLPLIEKKWSDLSEDLKAQLVSSLVGNLKFNKIPVPREQLKRKRLKDYYASRRNTVLTKGNAEKTKKRRLALKRSRLTLQISARISLRVTKP
ncbi:hypothetical protein EMCRGX_G028047 [Ephydatia muelleri]